MDLHEQGMSSRTFVIAAIVCVLLQAGLAPQISIAGGRVNFMIILVCLSVFSGDPTRAVFAAACFMTCPLPCRWALCRSC